MMCLIARPYWVCVLLWDLIECCVLLWDLIEWSILLSDLIEWSVLLKTTVNMDLVWLHSKFQYFLTTVNFLYLIYIFTIKHFLRQQENIYTFQKYFKLVCSNFKFIVAVNDKQLTIHTKIRHPYITKYYN